jgi:hypothetical protein
LQMLDRLGFLKCPYIKLVRGDIYTFFYLKVTIMSPYKTSKGDNYVAVAHHSGDIFLNFSTTSLIDVIA